jgi:acetyl esterase/lipase/uncharacterized protein YraI
MGKKLFFLCFVLLLLAQPITGLAQEGGITVITADVLKLRGGPGKNHPELAKVPSGTSLVATARNQAADWVRVDYNGTPGWLYVPYLQYQGSLKALPLSDSVTSAPSSDGSPAAAPPVASGSMRNGDLLALELIAQSDRVDYYRMVYASDGLRIAGFYAEPRPEGRYPAVIYNRGGNRSTGALQGYEIVPLAEAGFVVAASQYRGGPGSEGGDNFGGGDVNDVLNLIPLLRARAKADMSRLVMFGNSRGGMMTYLALKKQAEQGRSDFRAAATASGLTDLFMWAAQDPNLEGFYQDIIGGTTVSNPNAIRARSATAWANKIRVPLLIQHGERDAIVSVEQAKALANALTAAGRTHKLVLQSYGEHGLFLYDEGMPETLRWFEIYIGRGESYDYNFYKPAIDAALPKLRSNW